MERKFEKQNHADINTAHIRSAGQIMREATESFLANLPIMVLGIVVALAVASEFFV